MIEVVPYVRCKDVKKPEYKTAGACGMDFYSPADIVILPNEVKRIDLGIKMQLPKGMYMELTARSGYNLNASYLVKDGKIDEDYRGEIGLIIQNINPFEEFRIVKGDRIAQGIIKEYVRGDLVEVEELDETDRGSGGFGHTGK